MCELYYILGFITVFSPNPNLYAEGIDFEKVMSAILLAFPNFCLPGGGGAYFWKPVLKLSPIMVEYTVLREKSLHYGER